jgi:hypothetical protein
MPAFTQAQFDILTTMIETAYNKHRAFSPCALTHDDIYNAFVKPEHIETCKEAGSLWGSRFTYSPERIHLNEPTRFFSKPFPLVLFLQKQAYLPDYALEQTRVPAGDAGIPISAEVDRVAESFRDYNLMTAVLTHLNEVCANPSQVAFLWPVVRELAAMAQAANEKVETLVRALDKGSSAPMPRVSMGLREACKATGATITILKMLGDPVEPAARPVHISDGQWCSIRVVFDPSMLAQLQ